MREGSLVDRQGRGLDGITWPAVVECESIAADRPLPAQFLKVRAPGPDGALDAIRLGSSDPLAPDDRQALGLYAQRVTPLFHQAGTVPAGTAHVGAFLPIYQWSDESRWIRVALPGYYVRSTMANRHEDLDNRGGAALVWVDKNDLGVSRLATPKSDPWLHPTNYRDGLSRSPGGADFTSLQCGPLRTFESVGTHTRVAQLRDGVEVVGWIDGKAPRGQGSAFGCQSRTRMAQAGSRASDSTAGVRVDPKALADVLWIPVSEPRESMARRFLKQVLRAGAQTWFRTYDDGCQSMTFTKATRGPDPWSRNTKNIVWLARTRDTIVEEDGWTTTYGYEVSFDENAATMVFSGPYHESTPPKGGGGGGGGRGTVGSMSTLQIVAVNSRSVTIVRGTLLYKYAPEDTAHLFLDRDACETSAAPNFVLP